MGCKAMMPTITTSCPSCHKAIIITGIKLVFDDPTNEPKHAIIERSSDSKNKGYIGWNKPSSDEELKEALGSVKTAPPIEDPNPENEKVREHLVETHKEEPPVIVAPEKKDPVIDESKSTATQQDQLVPLLEKVISILDDKVYPELHTCISSLIGEETKKQESQKKRVEAVKRFSVW